MDANVQKDRVRGSLIGGAIGDALGYPVEFISSYKDIQLRYGEKGITHWDTALISDDTQMTLFTALGILNAKNNGIAPIPAIGQAYIEWLYTQMGMRSKRFNDCWIGDLPEMNVCRAPGHTCIAALEELLQGREAMNNSKGCGGIMRIAPIPLYGLSQGRILNIKALNELAADAAYITHRHPLGYIPAYVLSHILYRLAVEESPTCTMFISFIREALQYAENKYKKEIQSVEYLKALLDKALDVACENLPDDEAIKQLGEGWVAEETLAVAIYCSVKYQDDFSKALCAAVNHDGDSDSTGAVTGNILGAYLGYEKIPAQWKENLECADVIDEIALDLCHGCIMSEYSTYKDYRWETKYIYMNK